MLLFPLEIFSDKFIKFIGEIFKYSYGLNNVSRVKCLQGLAIVSGVKCLQGLAIVPGVKCLQGHSITCTRF